MKRTKETTVVDDWIQRRYRPCSNTFFWTVIIIVGLILTLCVITYKEPPSKHYRLTYSSGVTRVIEGEDKLSALKNAGFDMPLREHLSIPRTKPKERYFYQLPPEVVSVEELN